MQIEHLLTPYKLEKPILTGSGVEGEYDFKAVDCPVPFQHNGKYYLLHVGFDGIGYQTGLAVSDDLVNWKKLGTILKRGSHMDWDKVGMAATTVLTDNNLTAGNHLLKWNGRYWLMYHSYPGEGYESGSAEVGLAWCDDEELLSWHPIGKPVFSWRDGFAWESGGLYKVHLIRHEGKFFIFYNAKNHPDGGWIEQSGMAVSDDLMHWERVFDHPVLPVTPGAWDSVFASDPQVKYDDIAGQWVMFYYGLGNLSACDGLAVSGDLRHWTKFPAPILTTGCAGAIDSTYAHKPGVIMKDGVLYHFYCACRPYRAGDIAQNGDEQRCISVARSIPWQ